MTEVPEEEFLSWWPEGRRKWIDESQSTYQFVQAAYYAGFARATAPPPIPAASARMALVTQQVPWWPPVDPDDTITWTGRSVGEMPRPAPALPQTAHRVSKARQHAAAFGWTDGITTLEPPVLQHTESVWDRWGAPGPVPATVQEDGDEG